MKRLIVTISLISALTSLGQPVLTATGMNPVVGDIFTNLGGGSINIGSTGGNQTWVFTGGWTSPPPPAFAQPNPTVGTVASSPFSSQFSASSNVQSYNQDVYAFMNTSSVSYQNTGYVRPAAVSSMSMIVNSDPEMVMQYPFSLNSSFTDTWTGTYNGGVVRTGTSVVTYDAYGTLILPNGTYNNVARIHTIQNFNLYFPNDTLFCTLDAYMWYMNGYHCEMASTSTITEISSTGSQVSTTGADCYYATPVGFKTNTSDNAGIHVFPNPASETLNIVSENGQQPVQLYLQDTQGKLIESVMVKPTPGLFTYTIPKDLPANTYVLRMIFQNGECETQKISIIK